MTLVVENLSAGYGRGDRDIAGITAQASPGEFIALVGPNGAGKTCLIKTIVGLITPTTGMVALHDMNASAMSAKMRARQFAYLAQDRTAAWTMPVRGLVALGRAPWRGPLGRLSANDERAITRAMGATRCSDLASRRFDQLSGGEQARVHLARAMAVYAGVLLADEPVASLDPYYQLSILGCLRDVAADGKIVIASLHDLTLARRFATRIWVMDKGRLVQDKTADAALGPDILRRVFQIEKNADGFALA